MLVCLIPICIAYSLGLYFSLGTSCKLRFSKSKTPEDGGWNHVVVTTFQGQEVWMQAKRMTIWTKLGWVQWGMVFDRAVDV